MACWHHIKKYTIVSTYATYCIFVPYRIEPYWPLCRYYSHLQAEAISPFTTPLLLVTKKDPREQRVSSWPFAVRKSRGSNRQDFIRPPGIARGAFEGRMDNVCYCKLLLLSEIVWKTDAVFENHARAFLSVMEEYTGCRKPGIYEIYVTYATYLIHTHTY